ncbi:MAG: DNA-processing protein DprA [Clostridia bacterium]|nr:DNA-processing protein DprA [Clostridia bacterium]
MADSIYWVWLAECIGPGCRDVEALIEQFGSPFEIFSADESQLYRIPGVSESTTERLCKPHKLDAAYQIVDRCALAGIGILCYDDPAYPARLRTLRNPPAVLYYRGKMPDLEHRVAISMVGTRSMSEYGGRTSYKIAYELASANALIISGMALGVDGVSHAAALAAGGETIAVLGCGVDVIYPAAHAKLRDRILEHGAVISEYPPGTEAAGHHFPMRNRIISGLSHGTLVVEADLRSGAMITAREALAQGRDLFAVPGNVGNFHSAGTNQLIHAGANMVLTAKDVLDNYTFLYRQMLNLPAYHAAVEHSDLDQSVLDAYGVAARPADFKSRRNTDARKPSAPANREEKKRISPPHAPKPSVKATVPPVPKQAAPDETEKLSSAARAVFEKIPEDRAVSSDALHALGISQAELSVALIELSLAGLIDTLPGNYYIRTNA